MCQEKVVTDWGMIYDHPPDYAEQTLFCDFRYGIPDRILLITAFDPAVRKQLDLPHPFPQTRGACYSGSYLFFDTYENLPFMYQIAPLYAGRSGFLYTRLRQHFTCSSGSFWLNEHENWMRRLWSDDSPTVHIPTGIVKVAIWYSLERHKQVAIEQSLISHFAPRFNKQASQ